MENKNLSLFLAKPKYPSWGGPLDDLNGNPAGMGGVAVFIDNFKSVILIFFNSVLFYQKKSSGCRKYEKFLIDISAENF